MHFEIPWISFESLQTPLFVTHPSTSKFKTTDVPPFPLSMKCNYSFSILQAYYEEKYVTVTEDLR